jgi:hypothetical protein
MLTNDQFGCLINFRRLICIVLIVEHPPMRVNGTKDPRNVCYSAERRRDATGRTANSSKISLFVFLGEWANPVAALTCSETGWKHRLSQTTLLREYRAMSQHPRAQFHLRIAGQTVFFGRATPDARERIPTTPLRGQTADTPTRQTLFSSLPARRTRSCRLAWIDRQDAAFVSIRSANLRDEERRMFGVRDLEAAIG